MIRIENLKKYQRYSLSIIALSLFLSTLAPFSFAAEIPETDEIYQGAGIESNAAVYGNEVNESIDPFTGQLVRTYTDLSLPGNAGHDLSIQRIYYSKLLKWQISFGRIKRANNVVTIELPDGSVHYGYKESALDNENFMTKGFWKIYFPQTPAENDMPVVQTSDGTQYTFGYATDAATGYFYTTSIDKNNNTIAIHYQTGLSTTQALIDYVVDSVGREIYFEYENFADSGTPIYKPTRFYYCSDFGHTCSASARITTKYIYYEGDQSLGGINPVLLKEVRPPLGASWHYTYNQVNSINRLQTVISPNGGVTTYTYDFLDKYTPDGNYRRFFAVVSKGTSGRGVKTGTYTFNYDFNPDGYDYTTVTDPANRTTQYKYIGYSKDYPDNNASSGGTDECWQFGLVQEVLVRGADSSVESRTTAEWEVSPFKSFPTPNHRVAGLCGDSVTHIPRVTLKSIERDGKTHVTKYEAFDLDNNPTIYYEESTIGASSVRREFEVESYWKNTTLNIVQGKPDTVVVTSDDFTGTKTTNYSYNSFGLVTETDSNGVSSEKGYYTDTYNLLWEEDPNNNRTTYQWQNGSVSDIEDALGNHIIHEINPDGTIKSTTSRRNYKTSYTYDVLGRLKKISPPTSTTHPSSATDISYPLTSFSYGGVTYNVNSGKRTQRLGTFETVQIDGFGRQTGTSDNLGITTTTDYHANGLKNYTTSSIGDTTYFDAFSRPVTIEHKDGTSLTYNYADGNVLITDEESYTTLQTYYAFSDPDDKLLASVRDAKQTVTRYTYNIAGQLTDVVFGTTNVAHFGYDSRFYLTSTTHPETGTVTYTKDNAGNMTSITDTLGTRTYVYDDLNRLDYILDGGTTIADYAYDLDDNTRLISNDTVESTMVYDPVNRLSSRTDVIGGKIYATTYKYNPLDNLRQISYPSGRVVSYVINSINQVVAIPGFVNSVQYETAGVKNGLISTIQLNNGTIQQYDYTDRRMLTTLLAEESGTGTDIVDRTHSYGDDRGNLTQIIDRVAGSTRTFGYDELNRLTTFSGPWGSGAYSYTNNGNRSSKRVGSITDTYTFNNTTNRLYSVSGSDGGSFAVAHNTNGDVTQIVRDSTTAVLGYDKFHNLTSYTANDQTDMSFGYDVSGQRVLKRDEHNATEVIYQTDLNGNTLSEFNGNDELLADYIYLDGKMIARVADTITLSDSDLDGINDLDEVFVYGTDPDLYDTDDDGIGDGDELAYWGENFDADGDGDGLINLLDPDSDNDDFLDGEEISQGFDPSDPENKPERHKAQLLIPMWMLLLLDEEPQ